MYVCIVCAADARPNSNMPAYACMYMGTCKHIYIHTLCVQQTHDQAPPNGVELHVHAYKDVTLRVCLYIYIYIYIYTHTHI